MESVYQQFPPKRVNIVGAFSLVLAVGSLSCAWVPICGMAQWPLAIIALILGIVGAVISTDNRTGSGIPIAGILISVLALILPLVSLVWAANKVPPASQPSTTKSTDQR